LDCRTSTTAILLAALAGRHGVFHFTSKLRLLTAFSKYTAAIFRASRARPNEKVRCTLAQLVIFPSGDDGGVGGDNPPPLPKRSFRS
jgi:hypothetical protein